MRIAMDARMITYTGIGRYIGSLVKALSEADDGCVYTLLIEHKDRHLVVEKENIILSEPRGNVPVYSIAEQYRLPFEMGRVPADVIHYPSFNMPVFNLRPTVVTIHDLYYYINRAACPSLAAHLYVKVLFNAVARSATKIITGSEHAKKEIVKHLRVDSGKITVIYHGVDAGYKRVDDAVKIDSAVKRYGIKGRYIFYVGAHGIGKNLNRLVEAYASLSAWHSSVGLVIAGKIDERRRDLYELPERLGVGGRVSFIGKVDESDMSALYSGADIFVFPSLYEGFGIPPIEAMACGTPVIASNATSLPEVVGDAAITFDPMDINSLTYNMDNVLSSETLRSELREKGYKRASEFSWQDTAKKTLVVYREAALLG